MYLTVTCSEGVGAITEEEIVRETSNTFLGDYRTRTHLRACQEWSRGDISADFYEPVKSNVPVLMLSSEFDPRHRLNSAAPQRRFCPTAAKY
jgi:hypothetical protein